jgi:ABC-type maltose transport system permease subunit
MAKLEKTTSTRTYVAIYAILIVFTLLTIYPILHVIGISLRPGDLLHTTSLRLIPQDATLDSYRKLIYLDERVRAEAGKAWDQGGLTAAYRALGREKPFIVWMINSSLVSSSGSRSPARPAMLFHDTASSAATPGWSP